MIVLKYVLLLVLWFICSAWYRVNEVDGLSTVQRDITNTPSVFLFKFISALILGSLIIFL